MTWVWILLWFVLSSILLGAFFWSTIILQKQKRAWAAFAAKHKLKYTSGKYMDSPSIAGVMNGFNLSCFSAVRDPDDVKARRYVSVIEVKSPSGFAGSTAAGTPAMEPFLQTLKALSPYDVQSPHWDKNFHMYTKNAAVTKVYLDNPRIRHLNAILSLKNADVLVVYDDDEALVRVETPDPIKDVSKAEEVIGYIMKHIEPLLVDDRQRAAIRERAKDPDAL